MTKRVFLGALAAMTGLLLLSTIETAPLGFLAVGGGAYLLALPYLGERGGQSGGAGPRHGNPSQRQ
jgi:hypothetical protein